MLQPRKLTVNPDKELLLDLGFPSFLGFPWICFWIRVLKRPQSLGDFLMQICYNQNVEKNPGVHDRSQPWWFFETLKIHKIQDSHENSASNLSSKPYPDAQCMHYLPTNNKCKMTKFKREMAW